MAFPESLLLLLAGDAPAVDEPLYVPVPADVIPCVEDDGALGIVFASLLSGTDGFASSLYHVSRRLAL